MRRTVAMLLVVASPLLMAAPVTATDGPPAVPEVMNPPAAPGIVHPGPPAAPDAPHIAPPAGSDQPRTAPPTIRVRAVVAPPAAPVPASVTPSAGPSAGREGPKGLRPKVPAPAAVSDAAYAERLQAELCLARQVFCGVSRDGRYRAG